MSWRIGIDTGGTFTDLVAIESATGRRVLHKVHSTPDDPSRAVVSGTLELAQRAGFGAADIAMIVHGTTVGTNAVLESKGARVALVTTRGFRDVILIGRQNRPRLYDLRARRPKPLVPRRRILEVDERIGYDGSVLCPLGDESVEQALRQLQAMDAEAVVVALLHSHVNPVHEIRVGEIVRERLSLPVTLSHEVTRTQGEFERFSTAVINGYVQPVVAGYLDRLSAALKREGIDAPLYVMKSNGGVSTAQIVARQSVETLLSGPAGGVVAGAALAGSISASHLITADVGGTSFDVSVIRNRAATYMQSTQLSGLALQLPMLDIHTIGAGGGSIGWIDAGGALRVGPQSAGAVPGPACYGRGGDKPTVTDANLVLGRIAPRSRLAGGMELDVEAARRALASIARPLGLSIEQAAEGVIRIVNTAMTAAIRKLTVERGYDPAEFALCVFGGAGPLHGAQMAREIGVPRVVVPPTPGVFSAIGLLSTDLREELIYSLQGPLRSLIQELAEVFDRMVESIRARLGRSGAVHRRLRLRYVGQGHDLTVELRGDGLDAAAIAHDFHRIHERLYGYAFEDEPIEVVAAWVSVSHSIQQAPTPARVNHHDAPRPSPTELRCVWHDGRVLETPVYDRDACGPGMELAGPAIVEQADTTTWVPPGCRATVDTPGNLILDVSDSIRVKRNKAEEKVTL